MKGGPQTWDEEEPVSVEKACISLDGTRIAAVFVDGTLCIYDTTTGEEILPPFKVDDEYPRPVVFSPDGKLVATGGRALRLWDVLTGEEVESFDIHVYSLAFSPDGTCIAAGCDGRDDEDGSYNIRVVNLELAKNPHPPHHFISSGGESILLLKGEVWPSPFEGHEKIVLSLSYSADGKQIASCSWGDRTIRVWDVLTGSKRTIRTNSIYNYSVAFSPDGTQIASDGILYNLTSDTRHTFGDSGQAHSFSADGRFIASGFSGGVCQIWDASTHETIQLVGHRGDVGSVFFFFRKGSK